MKLLDDEFCTCGAGHGSLEGHTDWCRPHQSGAEVSDCGRFRYALTRRWDYGPTALFIMLNPSTADANEDDPTIRRCIGFAKREGCGGLRVENLFAFRATDPDKMFRHAHTAVGESDRYILLALADLNGPLICAWGADKRAKTRADHVIDYIIEWGAKPLCLGRSKSGAPRHPLYLKSGAPLIALNEGG